MGRPDGMSGILAEVADLAGVAAALALAERYGGDKVHVPARPRPDSPLARCIGADTASALGERYGGENIAVPLGPVNRTRRVEVMLCDGARPVEIIRKLRVSRRTVERAAARLAAGTAPGRGSAPETAQDGRQMTIDDFL